MFFYKQDKDIQIIFVIPSFILFIALALMAFNIERTDLDSAGAWHTQATTEYVYVLYNFMMAVISFIYGFILIMERMRSTIQEASTELV